MLGLCCALYIQFISLVGGWSEEGKKTRAEVEALWLGRLESEWRTLGEIAD